MVSIESLPPMYNIRSVTVAEIMGRHAGWLAGAACLAGGEDCEGPDLILLPEVPLSLIHISSASVARATSA